MKAAIHPDYYQVEVTCVCGNKQLVGSTKAQIRVEICNACHPVFNGNIGQRMIDTEGRVERFNRRFNRG